MIYLDHAATGGTKAPSVQNAVLAATKQCANPGRSGHKRSIAQAEVVLACRILLNDLFHGYGYERVVFTKNCTEALNLALLGVLNFGDHVVTTSLEHNSVLRPLTHLSKQGIITYSVAPLTNGKLCPESIAELLQPNTRMCVVTTASNVTGETPDLNTIRNLLPPNVLLVCDGAQGAGHVAIDMQQTGIDALAIAGHKGMGGIQGSGALLFSERIHPRPVLFGGTGSESGNLNMPDFYPDRLESGTLSYPAICSLYEGAIIVKERRAEYENTLLTLSATFLDSLNALNDYIAYFSPNKNGICSFRHKTIPSEEIAEILSERYDIAVRGGLHCAALVHKALKTYPDGLVRASFSPQQGAKERNALLAALKEIATSV